MKCVSFFFIVWLLSVTVSAQTKEFEGVLEYRVTVHSKSELISEQDWKTILATGNKLTIQIKQGSYMQHTGPCDQYFVPGEEKIYLRFKGIDTLFWLDYTFDTSALLEVKKLSETKTLAGHECQCILIRSSRSAIKYCYDTSLYLNPEYDKNNKAGKIDVFSRETHSVWLGSYEETLEYSVSNECVKVEAKKIDAAVFVLPDLPVMKFELSLVYKDPVFTKPGGWDKYLSTSLNADLGLKHIRIPKGGSEASQTVYVVFLINEYGQVQNPQVENKKDVHPKLAEEAIRVIANSPSWKPATIYGQRTFFRYRQPVTFSVSK